MCGRYTIFDEATDVKFLMGLYNLDLTAIEEIKPNYNAAPTHRLPVVFENHHNGQRVLNAFQWKLIPFWSKTENTGYNTFNAKAEEIVNKPSYRKPFKSQRCLVPMSGYIEWNQTGEKKPHLVRFKDQPVMTAAGVYDRWVSKDDGHDLWSFSIIVTNANKEMDWLHPRMPVFLHPEEFDFWLKPNNNDTDALQELLVSYPASEITEYIISKKVNSIQNNSPDLIKKVG